MTKQRNAGVVITEVPTLKASWDRQCAALERVDAAVAELNAATADYQAVAPGEAMVLKIELSPTA